MADRSKVNFLFRKIIFPYIKKNFLITGIAGYYFIGLILYVFAKVDILIPCIWHTLFDIRCPGCGLTRAFIELLGLNFTAAWDSNPLIFIVFPALSYYIIRDFVKFVKNNK
ncbi:MAG: DUF2752 domain-containing protein [Bacteroidales bacterium]|nr:DUF2752 domain-containing protein [Bacteroidales bacterium]MDD3860123.1 DUF2752 domain-containing protein [Bacteroidales bacterium]